MAKRGVTYRGFRVESVGKKGSASFIVRDKDIRDVYSSVNEQDCYKWIDEQKQVDRLLRKKGRK